MALRLAFAGFRHGHIIEIHQFAEKLSGIKIVGAAEDHEPTARTLKKFNIRLTHPTVEALFADANSFDALAVGDYFGRRGELAIRALELGKHVILDKPICTKLDELDRIQDISGSKNLRVGCQLSLRGSAPMRTLKRLVREGTVGRVHTVNFMGQHPLMYGTRDSWYFEEGKHGGTINDIGVHAIDFIPWMLGARWDEIAAARVWNERIPQCKPFNVGAQMMLTMADGAGVIGDVSYLSPDSQGYSVPQYWRFTLHGDGGILETSSVSKQVKAWKNGDKSETAYELDASQPDGYFTDFINEVSGRADLCDLKTEDVLKSARAALLAQKAADENLTYLKI
jgi:predicted dehydrogenase